MPKSILVLEEDASMRELLAEALEEEGHQVRQAGSGAAALSMGRKRLDLVVADLPRAGGDGCLAALKGMHPGLKTLVITSHAREGAPFRSPSSEADHYLYKPFELATLQRAVRRALKAEPAGYAEVVARVLEGYRRLASATELRLESARQALQRARLLALEPERDRLYRQFLQGVRSGGLHSGAALRIWDQLEVLEEARDRATGGGVDWQQLREGFRYLADLAVALGRAGTAEPAGRREPGQVPREAFAGLYRRLQRGELSVEQLKRAPLLRTAGSAPGRSAEARALARAIWGGPG